MQHPDQSRVIVTRIEPDGRSNFQEVTINADTGRDAAGVPLFKVSHLWGTADGIGSVGPGENMDQVFDPWFPGPGGIRFRLFTFMPTPKDADRGDQAPAVLEDVKGDGMSDFLESFDPERPGMHIHDTVDFLHVLAGEVVLELEHREMVVKQGDFVILRGGWHNWRNETDQPCIVSAVLVGADRTNPK